METATLEATTTPKTARATATAPVTTEDMSSRQEMRNRRTKTTTPMKVMYKQFLSHTGAESRIENCKARQKPKKYFRITVRARSRKIDSKAACAHDIKRNASSLILLRLLCVCVFVCADVLQVLKRISKARKVAASVVVEPVLLEQSLNAQRGLGMAELRHGREHVVLNLEIQVRHPPVHEPMIREVCCMVTGIFAPMDVLVRLRHIQMRVRHRKVSEDVCSCNLLHKKVAAECSRPRVARQKPAKLDIIPHQDRKHLHVLPGPLHVSRMKEDLPT